MSPERIAALIQMLREDVSALHERVVILEASKKLVG